MNNEVFEEMQGAEGGAKAKLEKQARQLAYDTKYKVKQALAAKSGGKADPATVSKMYMAQLSKSPAPPAVKALAKKKLLGEEYVDVREFAVESVTSALLKVFVEKNEEVTEEIIEEEEKKTKSGEQKFHVKVTDKKTGNTYRRYATRAKIAELRSNPNISSVEMTHHGEQSAKERTKGADTAAVKSGKGLDPVGKEDKDIDNDGDHDKTDKYLLNRRKVRGKAIATRKEEVEIQEVTKMGVHSPHEVPSKNLKKLVKKAVKRIDADNDGDVDTDDPKEKEMGEFVPSPDGKKKIKPIVQKEDFLSDWRDELFEGKKKDDDGEETIDVMKGKNKVTVSPSISEKMNLAKADMGDVVKDFYKSDAPQFKGKSKKKRQQMAIAAKLTAERGGKKLGEECGCETCPKCGKSPCECDNGGEDPRGMKTKANLVRNKLRAMGLKMSHEPEGQLVEYAAGGGSAPQMPARVSKFVDELPSKVKSAGSKVKGAIKSIPSGHSIKGNEIQMNSNQLEGELIEERDEQKEEEKGQKETLANIKKITGKKQRLDKEKYTLQRKGKLPLNMGNEVEGQDLHEIPAVALGAGAVGAGLAAYKAISGMNAANKIKQDAAAGKGTAGRIQNATNAKNQAIKQMLNQETEIEGEMTEEASDRARDRRQERGGVGGNVDYRRPPAKKLSNAELGIKPMTDEQREKRRKEIAAHFKKMKK